jgi:hypothetical protein
MRQRTDFSFCRLSITKTLEIPENRSAFKNGANQRTACVGPLLGLNVTIYLASKVGEFVNNLLFFILVCMIADNFPKKVRFHFSASKLLQ